jgi:hypothetical protein
MRPQRQPAQTPKHNELQTRPAPALSHSQTRHTGPARSDRPAYSGLGDPWFGRGDIDARIDLARIKRPRDERDPFAALKEMRFEGGSCAIHPTQLHATKGLMFDYGMPLIETVGTVLNATRDAARGLDWNWLKEEAKVAGMCFTAVNRWPQLHPLLPDVLYSQWRALHRQTGRVPRLQRAASTGGWAVVEAAEEQYLPDLAVIEAWWRRVMDDATLPAAAIRFADLAAQAIRATGYSQISALDAAEKLKVPQRTLERARRLLVERNHLQRVPGGGREARLVPTTPTKFGGR